MPETKNRPLKVFLCHASDDKPTVRELYRRLSAEGWLDVWVDEEKLLPGQEWDLEIEKAVEEADVVLVTLSTSSVDKEGYIQKELRFVLNIADQKPDGTIFIVPIRLNDCSVPRRLRNWHYVDYYPKNRRKWAFERILYSLKLRSRRLGLLTGDLAEADTYLSPDDLHKSSEDAPDDTEQIHDVTGMSDVDGDSAGLEKGEKELKQSIRSKQLIKEARSFEASGYYFKAIEMLNEALRVDPNNETVYKELVREKLVVRAYIDKKFEEAGQFLQLAEFTKALDILSDIPRVTIDLQALERCNQFRDRVLMVQRHWSLLKDSNDRAQRELEESNFQFAAELLKSALDSLESDRVDRNEPALGTILARTNELLEKAKKGVLLQTKILALMSKAQSAYHFKQYEDAISFLEQVLQLEPGKPNAVSFLQIVEREKKERDRMVKILLEQAKTAIGSDNLSQASDLLNQIPGSAREWPDVRALRNEVLFKQREANYRLYYEQGGDALRRDNYKLAVEKLQGALEMRPDDFDAQKLLADARRGLQAQQREDAQKFIAKGDEENEAGNYLEAVHFYNQALQADPDNVTAKEKRDIIQRELKRVYDAKRLRTTWVIVLSSLLFLLIAVTTFFAAHGPERLATALAPTPTFTRTLTLTQAYTSTPTDASTPAVASIPVPSSEAVVGAPDRSLAVFSDPLLRQQISQTFNPGNQLLICDYDPTVNPQGAYFVGPQSGPCNGWVEANGISLVSMSAPAYGEVITDALPLYADANRTQSAGGVLSITSVLICDIEGTSYNISQFSDCESPDGWVNATYVRLTFGNNKFAATPTPTHTPTSTSTPTYTPTPIATATHPPAIVIGEPIRVLTVFSDSLLKQQTSQTFNPGNQLLICDYRPDVDPHGAYFVGVERGPCIGWVEANGIDLISLDAPLSGEVNSDGVPLYSYPNFQQPSIGIMRITSVLICAVQGSFLQVSQLNDCAVSDGWVRSEYVRLTFGHNKFAATPTPAPTGTPAP